MGRKSDLLKQLENAFKELIVYKDNYEMIGTLAFWCDEYSASLEFCQWKLNEIPWGVSGNDNINLEQFDLFEEEDQNEIDDALKQFYTALVDDPGFKKLPVREGFNFCISYFDGPAYALGEPLKGLQDPCHFSLEESIDVVKGYIDKSFKKTNPSPLQKIVLKGAEVSSVVELFTDQYVSKDDFSYFPFKDWDMATALTGLSKGGEEAFTSLCEKIISGDEFKKFPKRHLVIMYIVVSSEEYYANIYESDKDILRPLDEMSELKYLYGNLDD